MEIEQLEHEISEAKLNLQLVTIQYVKEKEAIEYFIKQRERELNHTTNPPTIYYSS